MDIVVVKFCSSTRLLAPDLHGVHQTLEMGIHIQDDNFDIHLQ